MQPVTVFILLLFFVMVYIVFLIVKDDMKLKRERKKENCQELKVNPLLYYDSDFTIIAATIENSKNYWHLMTVLDDVNCFTLDYSKCQNENLLISDTNELLSRWRSKKIAYELEMFYLN